MSLYSLPCLQEVDGITVLWGVRGAAGLFPCEGITLTSCFICSVITKTVYNVCKNVVYHTKSSLLNFQGLHPVSLHAPRGISNLRRSAEAFTTYVSGILEGLLIESDYDVIRVVSFHVRTCLFLTSELLCLRTCLYHVLL